MIYIYTRTRGRSGRGAAILAASLPLLVVLLAEASRYSPPLATILRACFWAPHITPSRLSDDFSSEVHRARGEAGDAHDVHRRPLAKLVHQRHEPLGWREIRPAHDLKYRLVIHQASLLGFSVAHLREVSRVFRTKNHRTGGSSVQRFSLRFSPDGSIFAGQLDTKNHRTRCPANFNLIFAGHGVQHFLLRFLSDTCPAFFTLIFVGHNVQRFSL